LYRSFILCRIGGEVLPEAASNSLGSSSIHNTIYSSGSQQQFLKKNSLPPILLIDITIIGGF